MDTGSKHGADTSTNPPPPALQDEEAPDPDEDDLDELDGIHNTLILSQTPLI